MLFGVPLYFFSYLGTISIDFSFSSLEETACKSDSCQARLIQWISRVAPAVQKLVLRLFIKNRIPKIHNPDTDRELVTLLSNKNSLVFHAIFSIPQLRYLGLVCSQYCYNASAQEKNAKLQEVGPEQLIIIREACFPRLIRAGTSYVVRKDKLAFDNHPLKRGRVDDSLAFESRWGFELKPYDSAVVCSHEEAGISTVLDDLFSKLPLGTKTCGYFGLCFHSQRSFSDDNSAWASR